METQYMTTSKQLPIPPQNMMGNNQEAEVINTRFGEITINREDPIIFKTGMLGMPELMHYCLTDFPNKNMSSFKLLQSLDNLERSFIVLPMNLINSIIEQRDIDNACRDLEMSHDDTSILMIVTVHRTPSGTRLSINARAPIFINVESRTATQYVFHSNKYEIQHMISE